MIDGAKFQVLKYNKLLKEKHECFWNLKVGKAFQKPNRNLINHTEKNSDKCIS